MEDIKNMNVRNWKKVAQNRDSWKKAVEQARTLNRLYHFIRKEESVSNKVTYVLRFYIMLCVQGY